MGSARRDELVDGLGKLSLAEWEYAYRYADHLAVGERRPDPAGFDPERIAEIERRLDERWYAARQRLSRRRRR